MNKVTSELFVLMLLLSSCGGNPPIYYGIANKGSESTYLTKALFTDTAQNNNYLSGKIYFTAGNSAYNKKESESFAELKFHRSHTRHMYHWAYGFMLYGGDYSVNEIPEYKGSKGFYGAGITNELSINLPSDNMEWRPLGIRTTFIYENGRYASFRKNAARDGLILNTYSANPLINFSLTHDIIMKFKRIEIGYYSAVGVSFRKIQENFFITDTQCLHLTYKRTTGIVQYNGIFFNDGLFESGNGPTMSLGFNYNLKKSR
jgi:hypothetical protein